MVKHDKKIIEQLSYIFGHKEDLVHVQKWLKDKEYNKIRAIISEKNDMFTNQIHYIRSVKSKKLGLSDKIKMVQLSTICDKLEDYFIDLTEKN